MYAYEFFSLACYTDIFCYLDSTLRFHERQLTVPVSLNIR
jgi:hypothetical protein